MGEEPNQTTARKPSINLSILSGRLHKQREKILSPEIASSSRDASRVLAARMPTHTGHHKELKRRSNLVYCKWQKDQ